MFNRVQTSRFVIQHSTKVVEKFLSYSLYSLYVSLITIINYPNISCHEHTQNFRKWDPNTIYRTNLANITGRYSCRQNSKNYISDVSFNYFYSDSWKVPRIKADVWIPMNSTVYYNWCTTFDFLVVFNGRRFILRARGTRISYDRWSDTAHVVASYRQLASRDIYLFSRLRSNRDIPCVQWERATLPILNHIPQTFSLSFALFCRRVLARKK